MSIFIKFPIGLSLLFLTSLSHIHADTLSDSWAVCQASEDSTSCDGECNQSNNIITIVESGAGTGGPSDADSTSSYRDNCNEKPDEYRITFFKAGLCKTDPYNEGATLNPTSSPNCYNFFEDTNGKSITLTYNSSSNTITQSGSLISGSINFELGTYNYAYVIVDNHLEIKHQQTFSSSVKGYHVNGGTDFSSGDTCWTNGIVTTYTGATGAQRGFNAATVKAYGKDLTSSSLAMTCGSSASASPVFNKEIIENLSDDPGEENATWSATMGSSYFSIPGTSDKGIGKLLQNDNITTATDTSNVYRIFYPVKFSSPLVIGPEISTFEMSFGISGSVSLDFTSDGSNNLIAIKAGADPFTMKFTAR